VSVKSEKEIRMRIWEYLIKDSRSSIGSFTFEKGHPWIQGTYIQRFGYNTGPRGLSSELSRVAP